MQLFSLLLLLSFSVYNTHAQENESSEVDLINMKHKLSIKLTPTSLSDPTAVQLPIGVEYFFTHTGIYLQYGIPLRHNYKNTDFNNMQLLDIASDTKLKLEVRRYLHSRPHSRFHYSLELAYRRLEINRHNSSYINYHRGYLTHTSFTSAKLRHTYMDCGLAFGGMHQVYKKCFLEWFIGIGMRIANGKYYDITGEKEGSSHRSYFSLAPKIYNTLENGTHFWLYPPFGIRCTYLLGK